MSGQLPRCPFPACPIRYRGGEDRLCADHAGDDTAASYDTRKAIWNAAITASSPGHDRAARQG